ncbi:MAG: hypothetical protein SGI86_07495 [Deltaproteobacteria bacterium]|nr:hypothetical protein [Deltaproteobacteria bacterium]
MRLFVVVAALATVVLSWIPSTHAQVGAENLNFDACIEVDAVEVARLLNLEIAARSTHSNENGYSNVRLTGHCAADGDVMVELVGTDPGGQSVHAERHFVWQRVEPEARARLLAIGIAEMLPEPPAQTEPVQTPSVVLVPVAVGQSTATRTATNISETPEKWVRIAVGPVIFSSGSSGVILNAQIAGRIGQHVGFGLTLDGIHSVTETSIATVNVGDAVFRCVALGPTAFYELRAAFVHARAQIGLTGGAGSLWGRSGIPDKVEGRAVYGFWGGPQVELATGFSVRRNWDIDLWIRAAYNLSSIRGRVVDRVTDVRGGLWYAIGLGIGRGF